MACQAGPVLQLTQEQIKEAETVAKKLHDRLRKAGLRNAHGLKNDEDTADLETTGHAAEMALAIHLGVPWTSRDSGDKFGPDIGTRTQVRSSHVKRSFHHLIVRSKDIEKYGDVPFVLVIREGNSFVVKGWMMSYEAVKVGKLWNGGIEDRPPAFFVHESKLHPIETLENP